MSSFEWTFCVCLLTCLLNWSVSGVKTVQSGVKWIRPDLLSKGSGFFFRDDHTYEDYLVPSFHDRVELRDPQMKDGDASVILKKINVKDRGRNKFVSVSKRSRNKRTLPDIEGSDQQITVKTGDDVTLQCLDTRGGDIELLEWRRQDLEENVFVWKQGKMSEDPQHPSFKNRVELRDPEMKDGNVSVILKNITIKDTGTYECYVRNSNTRPPTPQLMNTTNLTVTDLGGGAGHSKDGGYINRVITVQPGEDVLLPCQGPRGADIIFLQWIRPDLKSEGSVFFFRDDRTHENYQHPSFHGRVELRDPQMKDGDVSVILKNIKIKDIGTYECYVRIKGSRSEFISSVHLKVKFSDQQITVKTGDDVTLQCLDHRGGDIELLQWKRQELTIFVWKHEKISEDLQDPSFKNRVELRDPQMKDGDVSVILKKVTINDNGTYECRVRNSNTQAPQLITNITLTVTDQQITVKTGDDVTLQCLDHRGGDIELLEWRRQELEENVFVWKNGEILEDLQHPSFKNRLELRDPEMKDGNVSVILKNVNINDTGTYECYVRNSNTQPPPQLINTTNLKVTDLGGDKYGGDRVGLIFGLSVVIVLAVFLVVGFTMYRKSKRLKMQIHQPPADEAAEPELQNLKRNLKEEEEEEEEAPVET